MVAKKVVSGLFYYLMARLLSIGRYDSKYFIGKYFRGKLGGIFAIGWRWIVHDAMGCKRLHVNKEARYPVSPRITIINPSNISFHPDDLNNFQGFGCYYQAIGHITIGRGTYIAPNVGIITANHSINDLDAHDDPREVILGERCWIGMNSVILPGVNLGDQTIVGAGSVVTKSFPDGNCVIAGNPAKLIRDLGVS